MISSEENSKAISIVTESMRTTGGFQLCDEQLGGISKISKNPIVLVNGRAGSGKSDMLRVLENNIRPENSILVESNELATSFMGINVSHLRRVFKKNSFTTHQLLHAHNKYCFDSPYYRPLPDADSRTGAAILCGKSSKHCIFEHLQWLIIEEMSTQDLPLYSSLISSAVRCGKLKRLVMLGDVNQCPSIRCGNVMKDVSAFCKSIGTLCVFQHDHRTSKANRILKNNIDSILGLNSNPLQFDGEFCVHIDTTNAGHMSVADYINSNILNLIKKWNVQEYQHHIITRVNKAKDDIIRTVEKFFHEIDPNTTTLGPYTGKWWTLNRKIAFTGNKHEDDIINNEILYIKKIEDETKNINTGKITTQNRNSTSFKINHGTTRMVTFSTLDGTKKITTEWTEWVRTHLKRCSASTVQSYQGSQCETIFFVLPKFSMYDTFENVVTAWTRSTYRIVYIGTLEDLYRAIKNPEPARRSKLPHYFLQYFTNYKYQGKIPTQQSLCLIQTTPIIPFVTSVQDILADRISSININKTVPIEPTTANDMNASSNIENIKKLLRVKEEQVENAKKKASDDLKSNGKVPNPPPVVQQTKNQKQKEQADASKKTMDNQSATKVISNLQIVSRPPTLPKIVQQPLVIQKTIEQLQIKTNLADFMIELPDSNMMEVTKESTTQGIVYQDVSYKPGFKNIVDYPQLSSFIRTCVGNELSVMRNSFDLFKMVNQNPETHDVVESAKAFFESNNTRDLVESRTNFYYNGILQHYNREAERKWESMQPPEAPMQTVIPKKNGTIATTKATKKAKKAMEEPRDSENDSDKAVDSKKKRKKTDANKGRKKKTKKEKRKKKQKLSPSSGDESSEAVLDI